MVAQSQGLDSWQTARQVALVDIAMADGFTGFQVREEWVPQWEASTLLPSDEIEAPGDRRAA